MATVYGAHLSPEERELEMIMLESDAEWARIQAMEYIYEASMSAAYLEAERNVLAKNGTIDELEDAYLVIEAENEGKGGNILSRIGNWITTQLNKFGEWLSKVFNPKLKETDKVTCDKEELSWTQRIVNWWKESGARVKKIIDDVISGASNGDLTETLQSIFKPILGIGGLSIAGLIFKGAKEPKIEGDQVVETSVLEDLQRGAVSMLNDFKDMGNKISNAYNGNLDKAVEKREEKTAAKAAKKNGSAANDQQQANAQAGTGTPAGQESAGIDYLAQLSDELFEEKVRYSIPENWSDDDKESEYSFIIDDINRMSDATQKNQQKVADLRKRFDNIKSTKNDATAKAKADELIKKLEAGATQPQNGGATGGQQPNTNPAGGTGANPQNPQQGSGAGAQGQGGQPTNSNDPSKFQNGSYEWYDSCLNALAGQINGKKDYDASIYQQFADKIKKYQSEMKAKKYTTARLKNSGMKAAYDALKAYKEKDPAAAQAAQQNPNEQQGTEATPAPRTRAKISDKAWAVLNTLADGVSKIGQMVMGFFSKTIGRLGKDKDVQQAGQDAVNAANNAANATQGKQNNPQQPAATPVGQESTDLSSLFGISDEDLTVIDESYNSDLEALGDLFATL